MVELQPDRPSLSIIVTTYNAEAVVVGCLESLLGQQTSADYEVIVVDSSSDKTAELVEVQFPAVRLIRHGSRLYCGSARNRGVAIARADVIAFTDADCRADPDWIEQILHAHRGDVEVVGGAIENGNPSSYIGWGAYLTEFNQWLPTRPAQIVRDVAGANVSYKRRVLERFGPFIDGTYCSDTELHWRLAQHGVKIHFDPGIKVRHVNIEHVGRLVSHELKHGWSFGRVRVRYGRFSSLRRVAYVATTALVATKLALTTVANSSRSRRDLGRCLRALPVVALGVSCWSAGEAIGYLWPPGSRSESAGRKSSAAPGSG